MRKLFICLFAALCALAGLAVSLPMLMLADRAIRARVRWMPQIVAIDEQEKEWKP